MNDESENRAAAAAALLGVDAQFEQMLEQVLGHLRQMLGVCDVVDPIVEAEFRRARARLELFGTEYRALYARAIANHLAADDLASVIQGLSHPGTRRFRAVEAEVTRDLAVSTDALSKRMADTLLFEPPAASLGDRE